MKKKLSILRVFMLMIHLNMLTACTVGPHYMRPAANIPMHFKEANKHSLTKLNSKIWKKAEPYDDFSRGEWWKIFHDQKLNALEFKLNQSNQTIINAYQNYREARFIVDEARAAFLPTLMGSVNFTRQNTNSSSSFSSGSDFLVSNGGETRSSSRVTSRISNNYTWLMNANWELDIWGSVRHNVEATAFAAQASAALLAATRLSLQSSLAQYYFELRGLDADQALLDRTVKEYKRSLQLTQNQYLAGIVSRVDKVQAQAQLETAQAAAINNGILRAQYEHAIAVLIGLPPAEFYLTPTPGKIILPPIPLVVPAELLERRPDIAQAERLMAQANAQIGVASAAYFPTLTLSGSASTIAKKLFALPFLNWSLSADLAETLFDGGLRQATVQAAWAVYCASVASYRQTILNAFQEVENHLASLRILTRQIVIQNQAASNAKEAVRLVINQYKSGMVAYSTVITAQIAAYNAEKNAIDLNYLLMTSAVGLVKALGGGWNASSDAYMLHT